MASSTDLSHDRITQAEDKAMDKEVPSNGHVEPGISIRMGPVDDMDVDAPATNGNANAKRKARSSITNGKSYKDASSSDEDDKPLVRLPFTSQTPVANLAADQASTNIATSQGA